MVVMITLLASCDIRRSIRSTCPPRAPSPTCARGEEDARRGAPAGGKASGSCSPAAPPCTSAREAA
eukprot:409488-Rhodomonas_salina.1